MIIVNPETRGPLGDSHLGEVRGRSEQMLFCDDDSIVTEQEVKPLKHIVTCGTFL